MLRWFQYLCDRTFRVLYNGSMSCIIQVTCSIPQGPTLGPRMFIMYTADLKENFDEHGVNYHACADNTQLYVNCCQYTVLEHFITDINQWMSANRLAANRLNLAKTGLLWSGSRHSLCKLGGCGPTIKLGADTFKVSNHVRLLGVIMSSDLSSEKHVSVVSVACLSQIRRVQQFLDAESAATLVHAFVTSRVNYCNAALAGSPKVTTDKLQRVMNSAARIVRNTRKFDSGLSRLLHDELHWLDVTDGVQFKLAMPVYRCLHGTALLYMMESCTQTADVVSRQHLRSASQRKMIVPQYRMDSYGRWFFAVVGPSTWNLLPDSLHDPALSLSIFRPHSFVFWN